MGLRTGLIAELADAATASPLRPHEWIRAVAETGRPFSTRLTPDGLDRVPGLSARLHEGGAIVDTACGAGTGVLRLASHYPACTVLGVDGDAYSLSLARERVADHPAAGRCAFVHSPLETMTLPGGAALVTNNISMHECRDIDAVVRNVCGRGSSRAAGS